MGGRCSYVPLAGQQMRAPARSSRVVIKKPATKERAGINPFTKEPTVFKARPARKIVQGSSSEGGQRRGVSRGPLHFVLIPSSAQPTRWVVEAGAHHVELVLNDKAVQVFVTNSADKPVSVTGFKGLAILTVSGKARGKAAALEPKRSTIFPQPRRCSFPAMWKASSS